MDYQREIDLSISALHSVRLIAATYASGAEGVRRVREVIEALEMHRSKTNAGGGLCPLIADAMRRRYLNSESAAPPPPAP